MKNDDWEEVEIDLTPEELALYQRLVDDPRTPYNTLEEFMYDAGANRFAELTDPDFKRSDNIFLPIPEG